MSNKKYFFFFFVLLALVAAQHAFAQGFVPLAPIPGLTGEGDVSATTEGLPAFFNNLYKLLIGVAALAAIIQIMRSGIELALNQGSVSEILSAKGRVAQAIYGLVLVLIPALVFGIINPNILNLSVSLPDITYTDRGSQETVSTSTTPTGVNIRVTGTYLKSAVFSFSDKTKVEEEAQAWVSSCNADSSSVFGYITSEKSFGALGFGGDPKAACPGGFQNGVCVGGFVVYAQCALKSSVPLTFVNLGVGDDGTVHTKLKAVGQSEGEFDSFKNTCSSDRGQTCVPFAHISPRVGTPQEVRCPANIRIPDGAPDAEKGGECLESYIVCSSPDKASLLCSAVSGSASGEQYRLYD